MNFNMKWMRVEHKEAQRQAQDFSFSLSHKAYFFPLKQNIRIYGYEKVKDDRKTGY